MAQDQFLTARARELCKATNAKQLESAILRIEPRPGYQSRRVVIRGKQIDNRRVERDYKKVLLKEFKQQVKVRSYGRD